MEEKLSEVQKIIKETLEILKGRKAYNYSLQNPEYPLQQKARDKEAVLKLLQRIV